MKFNTFFVALAFMCLFPLNSLAVDEVKIGYFVDRLMLTQEVVVSNPALQKKIEEIGQRLALATGRSDIKYTFRILNNPVFNAYAAPRGRIYINTGLFDLVDNEDQLAGVMAHEMAHVVKNHTVKALRTKFWGEAVRNAFIQAAAAAAGVAISQSVSDSGGATAELCGQLGMIGTNIALSILTSPIGMAIYKGYQKEYELEADDLALEYTARAGYDPDGYIVLLAKAENEKNRLKLNENNYLSNFLNAEPGLVERLRNAREKVKAKVR
ncbi:MAG: M48 family metalloprotease [Desulfotomaculaceae bacterium]|nr:M48 family metalloprotease [Desulfotomaculaceae bacterium]